MSERKQYFSHHILKVIVLSQWFLYSLSCTQEVDTLDNKNLYWAHQSVSRNTTKQLCNDEIELFLDIDLCYLWGRLDGTEGKWRLQVFEGVSGRLTNHVNRVCHNFNSDENSDDKCPLLQIPEVSKRIAKNGTNWSVCQFTGDMTVKGQNIEPYMNKNLTPCRFFMLYLELLLLRWWRRPTRTSTCDVEPSLIPDNWICNVSVYGDTFQLGHTVQQIVCLLVDDGIGF